MKFPLIHLVIALLSAGYLSAQNTSTTTNNQGMNPNFSIVENTQQSQTHKTLLAAMQGTDLEDLLRNDGPFTVFAPSDKAFSKMSAEKITELLKSENKKDLTSLLTYHIIAGKISASKILKAMCQGNGVATYTTIQGKKIVATMKGTDIILTDALGQSAKITAADAEQCNGVMHLIDSVILPKQI
ncbi:fasciclin domain-containing protein [Cellulophaga omnivescoria]|uniref:fasciclin domain-containing protein n=1 Tax=Cellulophaga omnivescoria TaxID=1888890 RepID=UPI001FE84CBE|nr:fasciclin domain-containing protein [Cellulophaga omnivescoria]WBU88847.1 fasciclin domain-containing protein [Cellulophaga omnivescoria]WKB80818.1 fasciclin domain-containing protein [Cellulophaga lytica]